MGCCSQSVSYSFCEINLREYCHRKCVWRHKEAGYQAHHRSSVGLPSVLSTAVSLGRTDQLKQPDFVLSSLFNGRLSPMSRCRRVQD
jgi:hypothetical protein